MTAILPATIDCATLITIQSNIVHGVSIMIKINCATFIRRYAFRSTCYSACLIVLLLFQQNCFSAVNGDFPGRQRFPGIPFIELESFHQKLQHDEILVVDVRTTYEFETLRIKKAVNIPLASVLFVSRVKELRDEDQRPIVTYCNGKTCMKSFKAAKKLIDNHIANVSVFDAGIMDFARTYPNEAELLGQTMKNANHLISQKKFSQHLIKPEDFGKHIANSNAILLDIRDRVQREDGISLFVGREHRVTLDSVRRLDRYIKKARKENRQLLVYDAAGKQVRWLQYRLEAQGVKNYFFMAGGANAYYKYLESM